MAKTVLPRDKTCTIDGCAKKRQAREMCAMHYKRWLVHGDPALGALKIGVPQACTQDGCMRPARSHRSPFCEMHYQRWWRRGTADDWEAKPTLIHSHGYILEYCPGHPLLSNQNQRHVYQHRRVYFDAHGNGPFKCHHCGIDVTWADMHVDHLDDDVTNNALENLVPSCPPCNQWRGRHKVKAKLRAKGVQITAFGQTKCVTEWAEMIGISRTSLMARLAAGWDVERAVTEPRGKYGPKARQSPAVSSRSREQTQRDARSIQPTHGTHDRKAQGVGGLARSRSYPRGSVAATVCRIAF